jgi:hypothetical protein
VSCFFRSARKIHSHEACSQNVVTVFLRLFKIDVWCSRTMYVASQGRVHCASRWAEYEVPLLLNRKIEQSSAGEFALTSSGLGVVVVFSLVDVMTTGSVSVRGLS